MNYLNGIKRDPNDLLMWCWGSLINYRLRRSSAIQAELSLNGAMIRC